MKKFRKISFYLVLMFANFCFIVPSFSQDNLLNEISTIPEFKDSLVNILIDKNDKYLPEKLFQKDSENLFINNPSQIEISSSTTIWFKINLDRNQRTKHLEIYSPNAELLNIYLADTNKTISSYKENINNTNQTLQFKKDYFNIELPSFPNQILVKLKISKYSQLRINLIDKNSYFKKGRILNSFYGFSLGIMLLLILYHLILYIKVKENLYLFYLCLVLTTALIIGLENEIVTLPIRILLSDLAYDLFQISAISLSIAFLNLKKQINWAFKILIFFIPIIFICRLTDIFHASLFSKVLINTKNIILYLTITIIAIISRWRDKKSDKLFILPWLLLLISQIIFSIYTLEFPNIEINGRHSITFGLLLNAIFLTLAFGNKLTMHKKEKKIAESNESKALSERDEIIHEQNKILETLITERNKEIIEKINLLDNQKQEIQLQNERIRLSNEELDLINEKLLNKNNEISDQNFKLEKQNQLLEEIVNNRTKKLLEEKEKSIVADKLKTSFLSNLDQEIQTPMNSITGFSTMLIDSSLTKEKRNEYLAVINSNVDILLESIDSMVLLARIQAGAIKPKIQPFDLNTLFNNCKEHFEEKTLNNNSSAYSLKIETPNSNKKIIIHSDYDKIWQIVTKLLNFAIKYSSHGEINLFYELFELQNHDGISNYHLIIRIKYCGPDLEEKLSLIFGSQNKIEINDNKSTHINEFGIEIAKGLSEILNGMFEIQTNNEGIIFSNKIPVLMVG